MVNLAHPFLLRGFKARTSLISFFFPTIGMEYLSRNLMQLKAYPNFNFHPRCERFNITHMMFADDLLMFYKTDAVSTSLMFQKFKYYLELQAWELI